MCLPISTCWNTLVIACLSEWFYEAVLLFEGERLTVDIPTRSQRPHSEWITCMFLKSVNVLICWLLDPGKMPWYSSKIPWLLEVSYKYYPLCFHICELDSSIKINTPQQVAGDKEYYDIRCISSKLNLILISKREHTIDLVVPFAAFEYFSHALQQ